MYTTCLFCSHALGRNESIESFPVGRRLAYDTSKGRLWVVCPSCLRWCLTPLETRWEAIESCERAFRAARVRASTSEISLVRLRDGLELVRVGAPLRPELAAWRYGREFSTRRRRALMLGVSAATVGSVGAGAAIVSGAGAAIVGLFAMGAPVLHMTGLLAFAAYAAVDSARATRLMHAGKELKVYRADLRETHLVESEDADGWGLRLKHSYGRLVLTGSDATAAATRLLARANGAGASRIDVHDATERLTDAPSLAVALRDIASISARLAARHAERVREQIKAMDDGPVRTRVYETRNAGSLLLLPRPTRLALEMALHEEREQRALEGELAPLVAAWREAEQIAGIADALLTPPHIDERLAAMRKRDS